MDIKQLKQKSNRLIDMYFSYSKEELYIVVENMQLKIKESHDEKEIAQRLIHLNIATLIMLIK